MPLVVERRGEHDWGAMDSIRWILLIAGSHEKGHFNDQFLDQDRTLNDLLEQLCQLYNRTSLPFLAGLNAALP